MSSDLQEVEALLVQRAVEGLDEAESRRLDHLLAAHPEIDAEWVDRLVGELDAATLDGREDPLPEALRRRLIESVPGAVAERAPGGPPRRGSDPVVADPSVARGPARRRTPTAFAWGGWVAAAVVAGLWFGRTGAPAPAAPLDFPAVAALSDAVVAQWEPGGHVTGSDVTGEVVWSASRQTGVMRLRGLAVNAPGEFQYQLWIFDRDRDERYPVDGGVFDVPAGTTEAEIAIHATLHVDDPSLFAVTVEPPGGVVVSDRERIATIAQVSD